MPTDEVLGPYRLLRPLGRGGMAEVYLAQRRGDPPGAEPVVIKTILPDLASDARFISLFRREGRMASQMRHPNLVRVFELGHADGRDFLVMEYLDGLSLRELARRTWQAGASLPLETVLRASCDAALGLAEAHALTDADGLLTPLIHRDISPDNIVLCRDGTTKVVDFGLARTMRDEDNLTRSTELRGKLSYMSPEQLQGVSLDGRSDVFSLGVTLFWLLTARSPFRGETDAVTIYNVLSTPPPDLLEINPAVPFEVAAVVSKALKKERENRMPSALALRKALVSLKGRVGDPADAARVAVAALALPAARPKKEPLRAPACVPLRRVETVVDGAPLSETLTNTMTAAPSMPERTLRLRLLHVDARDTTLEAAPIRGALATELDETLLSPPPFPDTAVALPKERTVVAPEPRSPKRRAWLFGVAASVGGVSLIAAASLLFSNPAPDAGRRGPGTAPLVTGASRTPAPRDAPAEVNELDLAAETQKLTESPTAAKEGRSDAAAEARPRPPPERRAQRLKRRPQPSGPSSSSRADVVSVQLRGPSAVRWRAQGRPLDVDRGRARLPAGVTSVEAYNPRTGGTSRVPVVDGTADYGALKKGSAFFLVRPWANVRLGRMELGATPFDPVQLVEGTYQVELRLDGRRVVRTFQLKPGEQTTIAVNMTRPDTAAPR